MFGIEIRPLQGRDVYWHFRRVAPDAIKLVAFSDKQK